MPYKEKNVTPFIEIENTSAIRKSQRNTPFDDARSITLSSKEHAL